jgi:hypothetical protein
MPHPGNARLMAAPRSGLLAAAAVAALTAGAPSALGKQNPWFPLRPGTTYRYEGSENGVREVDLMHVTRRTRTILGHRTTVVHDRVFERGRVVEDTFDYYWPDARGTVWYYGEDTKELDAQGRVKSREGSWLAGRDGGRQGIVMPARPHIGRTYRQEFLKGHAEDYAKIVSIGGNVITTHEWTPLEPGVLDAKYYERGVGTIREASIRGGHEYLSLVRVTRAQRTRASSARIAQRSWSRQRPPILR